MFRTGRLITIVMTILATKYTNILIVKKSFVLEGVKDMGELRLFQSFVDRASQDRASAEMLPLWSWWWQNRFKGGLISHSHLDHTGGMIISTQVNGKLSVNNKKRWFMNLENLQNHIDHVNFKYLESKHIPRKKMF